MRLVVKPHPAFFLRCSWWRGPSTPPASYRFAGAFRPRSSPAFFPRRRSPLALPGGERRRGKNARPHTGRTPRLAAGTCLGSAGVTAVPAPSPGLPSIRGGPATVPSTCYRIRLRRPARPNREPTHRTNGAFAGSPGGTAAALTDLPYLYAAAADSAPIALAERSSP